MKTKFYYTAKTFDGNDVRGEIICSSFDGALNYLEECNYTEIDVKRRLDQLNKQTQA